MSQAAQGLRRDIARLVTDELTIGGFVDVVLPLSWSLQAGQDPEAEDVAHEIELRLSEHSNGHLTEGELKAALAPLVYSYRVVVGQRPDHRDDGPVTINRTAWRLTAWVRRAQVSPTPIGTALSSPVGGPA